MTKPKYIYWHKRLEKWQVAIRVAGRQYHVGYYESYEDAIKERDRALILIPPDLREETDRGPTAFENFLDELKRIETPKGDPSINSIFRQAEELDEEEDEEEEE